CVTTSCHVAFVLVVVAQREEGVTAYYKGCASNIVRGVGCAIVLVLYDEMKRFVAS
ncbi:putative ADP/ATP carrier protein, partial [Toxoplasma gondii VAND]